MRVARGIRTKDKGRKTKSVLPLDKLRVSCFAFFVLLFTSCTVIRVTQPVVKIGLVAPFEGEYRYVGYDAIYAARLAVRQANAAGGVARRAGRTVELVAYDDRGTIEGARAAAYSLTRDPQVIAVVGHFRDETTAAARPIYKRAGLPLIGAGMVEGGTDDWLCPLLEYLGGQLDAGMVGTMGPEVAWSPCALELFLIEGVLPPAGVEALVLSGDPVSAGERLRFLRELGWGARVAGGPALGSPLFAAIAGEHVEGVLFATPYRWPEPDGADAAFSAAYQAVGPHVPPPGPFALTTYETMQGLLADIADGRTPSAAGAPAAGVYLYRRGVDDRLERLHP